MRLHLDKHRLLEVVAYLRQTAVDTDLRTMRDCEDLCDLYLQYAETLTELINSDLLDLSSHQESLGLTSLRALADVDISSDLYIASNMAFIACECAIDPASFHGINSHERQWLRETFTLPQQFPWIDVSGEPATYSSWSNLGISGVYKRGEPNPLTRTRK